jgi:hypothetical protein
MFLYGTATGTGEFCSCGGGLNGTAVGYGILAGGAAAGGGPVYEVCPNGDEAVDPVWPGCCENGADAGGLVACCGGAWNGAEGGADVG